MYDEIVTGGRSKVGRNIIDDWKEKSEMELFTFVAIRMGAIFFALF